MQIRRLALFVLAMMLVVTLSLSAVYAQDATATPGGDTDTDAEATETPSGDDQGQDQQGQTGQQGQPGMVACDVDLVLDLYIAEKFFGFSDFVNQMPADMDMGFDLNTFDRGQFGPLFDNNRNNMATTGQAGTLNMSAELRNHMMEVMAMSDTEFDQHFQSNLMPELGEMMGTDTSTLTMLQNPVMAGEAAECAALRSALRRFFIALVFGEPQFGDASMDMSGMGDTGTTDTSDTDTSDTTDTTGTGDTGAAAGGITVNLVPSEEVPGPGEENASGTAVVYLRPNANEVCVDISIDRMTLPATAAHIHQAADGQAGPPVVPLNPPGENGLSSTCAIVDATLMQDLINNPQNFYVNVHNAPFPDGAIRGQLFFGSTGATDTTGTGGTSTDAEPAVGAITVNLVGSEEIPGPGDDDGSGTAVVYLRTDTNEVCVDIIVQNITLPATAAHIHQAVDGQSGPPVVPLTAPGENGRSSTCAVVDAALMQEMSDNLSNFYVNVHNADFPDGAVRGQLQ